MADCEKLNFFIKVEMLFTHVSSAYRNLKKGLRAADFENF